MIRFLFRVGTLALAGIGAKSLYDKYVADSAPDQPLWSKGPIDLSRDDRTVATATDTPTGTDPNAKYREPGYQDKSLGQAVNQDAELADRLMDETGGDTAAAEARFRSESAGAPAPAEQEPPGPSADGAELDTSTR